MIYALPKKRDIIGGYGESARSLTSNSRWKAQGSPFRLIFMQDEVILIWLAHFNGMDIIGTLTKFGESIAKLNLKGNL